MKFTLLFLLLSFLIYGCKNKELPAKYLSTITVVRETGGNHNIRQTGEEATSPSHATPILPQQANTHSGTRYHIIVGSFSSAEKKRAEQLVEKLKAQDYPATLISSSQRYRVSIRVLFRCCTASINDLAEFNLYFTNDTTSFLFLGDWSF